MLSEALQMGHMSRRMGYRLVTYVLHRSQMSQWWVSGYVNDASLLGLMGREPARPTSKPSSNPSWDATVHPVCETFDVMCVNASI